MKEDPFAIHGILPESARSYLEQSLELFQQHEDNPKGMCSQPLTRHHAALRRPCGIPLTPLSSVHTSSTHAQAHLVHRAKNAHKCSVG